MDAPFERVLSWAKAGKLAGATVINDTGWANELAKYVPFVVLRKVADDHEGSVQLYAEYGADPRVIYQFGNEANIAGDCDHWLRVMRDADAHGRKVVIFNDSVGWTEDRHWLARRPALEYAKAHGHYVGLHCYGDVTKGDNAYCPMIDADHPDAFRWFAGRVFHLYSLMPDVQPDFIATEAGAGGFQENATKEQWLADGGRMDAFCQAYPWFKSFNCWTAGGKLTQFPRDSLDSWL